MDEKVTFEEKQKAYEQLQEFRKNYEGRKDLDYKKELLEYLDERYLNKDNISPVPPSIDVKK